MESINSSDIINKNFGSVFRGYNKSQVDNFLKILSKEFEILENKISYLKEKNEVQKIEVEKFKSVESSLINTLKTAEDTGTKIIDKAKEDVKFILDDSKLELYKIKEEYEKIKLLRDLVIEEINNLSQKINQGLTEINSDSDFSVLENNIDAIQDGPEEGDIDKDLNEVELNLDEGSEEINKDLNVVVNEFKEEKPEDKEKEDFNELELSLDEESEEVPSRSIS